VNIERTPPQSVGSTDEESVTSEERSIVVPAVAGALIVGLAIGTLLFYRKEDSAGNLTKNDAFEASSDPLEVGADQLGISVVATTPFGEGSGLDEANETDEATPATGPSPETPATSVDESGYEWYSNQDGHWYRLAGSNEAWIPYQG